MHVRKSLHMGKFFFFLHMCKFFGKKKKKSRFFGNFFQRPGPILSVLEARGVGFLKKVLVWVIWD